MESFVLIIKTIFAILSKIHRGEYRQNRLRKLFYMANLQHFFFKSRNFSSNLSHRMILILRTFLSFHFFNGTSFCIAINYLRDAMESCWEIYN